MIVLLIANERHSPSAGPCGAARSPMRPCLAASGRLTAHSETAECWMKEVATDINELRPPHCQNWAADSLHFIHEFEGAGGSSTAVCTLLYTGAADRRPEAQLLRKPDTMKR